MADKKHITIGTKLHKNLEKLLEKQENEKKEQISKFKYLIDKYHNTIGITKTDKPLQYVNHSKLHNLQNDIEEILIKLLPHGSGIDCYWEFTWFKNGSLKCSNFFHAMNNDGYYVKYIPISIKFFRHKKNEYSFYADKTKCQIIKKKDKLDYTIYAPNYDYHFYGLNDYLWDTMWYLNYLNKDWYLKTINKNEIVE